MGDPAHRRAVCQDRLSVLTDDLWWSPAPSSGRKQPLRCRCLLRTWVCCRCRCNWLTRSQRRSGRHRLGHEKSGPSTVGNTRCTYTHSLTQLELNQPAWKAACVPVQQSWMIVRQGKRAAPSVVTEAGEELRVRGSHRHLLVTSMIDSRRVDGIQLC